MDCKFVGAGGTDPMKLIERIVESWHDTIGEHRHRWESTSPSSPAAGMRCRCGADIRSDPGPHGFVLFRADGPNCGWVDEETVRRRREDAAAREAEDAKWRTRSGHDILLWKHWAQVTMFRGGWPNHNPGDRPVYIWICRQCGFAVEQQVASSFMMSPGVAVGIQDSFSQPNGLKLEVERSLQQRYWHLSSHGVDVSELVRQRQDMQHEISTRMSNVTCMMPPADIARMAMVFVP